MYYTDNLKAVVEPRMKSLALQFKGHLNSMHWDERLFLSSTHAFPTATRWSGEWPPEVSLNSMRRAWGLLGLESIAFRENSLVCLTYMDITMVSYSITDSELFSI